MRYFTIAVAVLAGTVFLSSCVGDYHNPAVEADAAGSTSSPTTLRAASGGVVTQQGTNVNDERKSKSHDFWGGAR